MRDLTVGLFVVFPDEFRPNFDNTPEMNDRLVVRSVRIRLSESIQLDSSMDAEHVNNRFLSYERELRTAFSSVTVVTTQ